MFATAIDALVVSWERRALSRTGIAKILVKMSGGRVLRETVAVAVAMGMQMLGPAAADMALLLEPELGSTLGCHRHRMTRITTRQLQRGGAFITHET